MKDPLKILVLSLWLVGLSGAEEPVVRVQSIRPAQGQGTAVLKQAHPGDERAFQVSENSTGYVRDRYITDSATIAALEFLIGGRVGINRDTTIEIVNERSVADSNLPVKRVILKNGSLWVKADAKTLKQPIEIQTNGGVMGIKGTEFTAETRPDGGVRVCCFESNSELGGVEIRDSQGMVLGVAKPGDEYQIELLKAPVVKHYQDINGFRNETLQRSFREMESNPAFQSFFGPVGEHLKFGIGTAYSAAASLTDIENGPLSTVYDLQSTVNSQGASLQTLVNWGKSQKENRKAPLSPCNLTVGPGAFPRFSWLGVSGARAYVLMLGRDEAMSEVLFTEQVGTTSLIYPSSMRPLEAGQYFWRVIPVDEKNQPVAGLKGAASTFRL